MGFPHATLKHICYYEKAIFMLTLEQALAYFKPTKTYHKTSLQILPF